MSDFKMTFPFDGIRRMSIKSVTIRELIGDNEIAARFRAGEDTKGIAMELVADSIVEVNGQLVDVPFSGWKQWTTRTLDMVRMCFNEVNGLTPEEAEGPIEQARAALEAPRAAAPTPAAA